MKPAYEQICKKKSSYECGSHLHYRVFRFVVTITFNFEYIALNMGLVHLKKNFKSVKRKSKQYKIKDPLSMTALHYKKIGRKFSNDWENKKSVWSESLRRYKVRSFLSHMHIFIHGDGGGRVVRRCCVSYITGASNWYWLTVGQGLLSL